MKIVQSRTKKKRVLILIALAVLLSSAVGYCTVYFSRAQKASTSSLIRYKVETRQLDNTIEVAGYLKPQAEQEIRGPIDGVVSRVLVQEGDHIKQGQIIAAMDTSAAEYTLAQIRYSLDQERFQGSRRKIALISKQLEAQQKVIDNLIIRAQFSGIISALNLKPGDVLIAGTSYGRLIDVSNFIADVEINEADIPRAKPGLPVEFRFPALPGTVINGRVKSLAAEAKINEQKLTVLNAKLIIDKPPPELLAFYSFNAKIKLGATQDILVLATAAIFYEGGEPHVLRYKADGSTENIAIETAGFSANAVRIISGLRAGDEIASPPPPTE